MSRTTKSNDGDPSPTTQQDSSIKPTMNVKKALRLPKIERIYCDSVFKRDYTTSYQNSRSRNNLTYITHNDTESLTKLLTFPKFRNGVVGVMTRLPVDDWEFWSWLGQKNSLFPSNQTGYSIWVSGAFSPGVKPPADHTPLSSAEITNEWRYTSTPW